MDKRKLNTKFFNIYTRYKKEDNSEFNVALIKKLIEIQEKEPDRTLDISDISEICGDIINEIEFKHNGFDNDVVKRTIDKAFFCTLMHYKEKEKKTYYEVKAVINTQQYTKNEFEFVKGCLQAYYDESTNNFEISVLNSILSEVPDKKKESKIFEALKRFMLKRINMDLELNNMELIKFDNGLIVRMKDYFTLRSF